MKRGGLRGRNLADLVGSRYLVRVAQRPGNKVDALEYAAFDVALYFVGLPAMSIGYVLLGLLGRWFPGIWTANPKWVGASVPAAGLAAAWYARSRIIKRFAGRTDDAFSTLEARTMRDLQRMITSDRILVGALFIIVLPILGLVVVHRLRFGSYL